jgi:phosphoribosylformylglycinamidine cyclo-ligase
MTESHYTRAGVNIDAGQQAVELMKAAIQATYTPQVLSETGSFGGLFDATPLQQMHAPLLVASTDGVGTKTKVAAQMGIWDTIGQDLVNHCINDILVQGARPLFFMDYVASDRLVPQQIAAIVGGMAQACQAAGCALLGGETAEMPGVYERGEVDVAGTIVGVVERGALIDGKTIQVGDAILALPSTGLHTNGYSLARHVLAGQDWHTPHPALGQSIGQALLAVHRSYLREVQTLRQAQIEIRGLAHITGGGIVDNLPRILTQRGARIQTKAWTVPPIFTLIQALGQIETAEMFRVFNMGVGLLLVIPPAQVAAAQALLPELLTIGEITAEPHQRIELQ